MEDLQDNAIKAASYVRPRIRAIHTDSGFWFVARDVWTELGLTDHAYSKVPKTYKGRFTDADGASLGTVNERGLMWMLTATRAERSMDPLDRVFIDARDSNGDALVGVPSMPLEDYAVLQGFSECLSSLRKVLAESKAAPS